MPWPPIFAGIAACLCGVVLVRAVRREHPARLALEIFLGAGVGGLPAAALLVGSVDAGRFTRFFLGLGFAFGIFLSTGATRWAARFLTSLPDANRFGPMAGATVGSMLVCALAYVTTWSTAGEAYLIAVGAAMVGSLTTLGLQLDGG